MRLASLLALLFVAPAACGAGPSGVDGAVDDARGETTDDAPADGDDAPADEGEDGADDGTADGSGDGPGTLRVLFVGNSYTYVNDLPGLTAMLAADGAPAIVVESVTAGGATLADHLSSTGAVAAIRRGGWDVVVLQGQSVEPLLDRAGFLAGAAGLAAEIAAVDAEAVFFETWARRAGDAVYAEAWSGGDPAAMQAGLHEAYAAAASAAGGRVAPAGDAWERAWSTHPEIVLHAADGSHPTIPGTYLAACSFVAALAGRDPRTLAAVPAGVTTAEAETLRTVAAAIAGF